MPEWLGTKARFSNKKEYVLRISYGKKYIDLLWLPLVMFIILVMTEEDMGANLLRGGPPETVATDVKIESTAGTQKIVTGIALILAWLRFGHYGPWMQRFFIAVNLFMLAVMVESFYTYNTPLMYPHVWAKFLCMFLTCTLYTYFRNGADWLGLGVVSIIMVFFLLNLVLFFQDVLSLSSFVDTERGFTSYTTHFLILPFLFFFNRYLRTNKMTWLFAFFAVTAFILFLNHRSVWLSSAFSMIVNLAFIYTKGKEKVASAAYGPVFLIPFVAISLVFSYVLADKPEVLAKISERVEDIGKADEQGTGKWRLEQFESYLPFILDHPIYGMRFEGFELPNQFISEKSNKNTFADGSGHHFHSFYFDIFFYFGTIGFLLVFWPIGGSIYKTITAPVPISLETIAFVVFIASGVIYGLSYLLSYYFFSCLGITIALLENNIDKGLAERAQLQTDYDNAVAEKEDELEADNRDWEQAQLAHAEADDEGVAAETMYRNLLNQRR